MKNIRPAKVVLERPSVSPLVLGATILLIFLSFVGLLLVNFWPDELSLEEGSVSPVKIMAERQVSIQNEQATDLARKRAAASVGEHYTFNAESITNGAAKIEETFLELDKAVNAKEEEKSLSAQELEALILQLPIALTADDIKVLLKESADERFVLQNGVLHIFYKIMDGTVTESGIEEVRSATGALVEEQLSVRGSLAQALTRLINDAIQVNQIPSFEKTKLARQAAMAAVQPVMTITRKGTAVVREGEVVTKAQIRILEELGLYKPKLKVSRVVGVVLLVLSILGVLFGYLLKYRSDLLTKRYLGVLAVILVSVATVCKLLLEVSLFLAPVAVASVLVTTLMDRRLGLIVTMVLAVFVGVMANSLPICAVSMLTGAVGVLALSRVDSRSQLISATLLVGLANLVLVLAFELMDGTATKGLLEAAGFGLLNGFLSGWVAVGAIPMFEQFSGITTHFRLLDLSHMNEPLLRRLTLEAPGTYQHSMMVANLSEQAARAIGADSLLCRVGAYYHDIGKMKRPRFFIENQMGLENPHDKLAPSLSTRIIHSHVKDGIEMARQAGLPDVLVDFITQHHGTSLVGYFYHQAKARSSEPVFEEDFRYPGPRPQSRETAILLLCDGLEAAARTLSHPTPEKLNELVEKMVKHNLDDGQLDDSGLSLKDIKIVKETLSRALGGIYHSRIEYPDAEPNRKKVTPIREKKSS